MAVSGVLKYKAIANFGLSIATLLTVCIYNYLCAHVHIQDPADFKEESNVEPDTKANDNNPILITIPIVAAVLIIALSISIIMGILYLRYRRNNGK